MKIASLLHKSNAFLGEGPLWHPARKSVFWVDIESMILYEYQFETGQNLSYRFDRRVSLVVRHTDGNLLLGFQGGIGYFNPDTGLLRMLHNIEIDLPNHRCNDGGCDANGRLWVGTMERTYKTGAGSLYSIDHDTQPVKKKNNISISNGLVWSADNTKMYFIDSPTQKVQLFNFSKDAGDIHFVKICIDIPKEMGTPDGMCIDEEGMLWIAHWGGYGVYRWNPGTGECIEKIEVPAPNVTACTFAGEQLDQLVITTARQDMNDADLGTWPLSGSLFTAFPGVRGRPGNLCNLNKD